MSESDSGSNSSNSEQEESDFDKNEKSSTDTNNTNQKNSTINNSKQSSIQDNHEESSTSPENSSADSSISDNIKKVQQNQENKKEKTKYEAKSIDEKKEKEIKDKTINENQQKSSSSNNLLKEIEKSENKKDENNDKGRKKKQKRKSLEVRSNSKKAQENIDKKPNEKRKNDDEVFKSNESKAIRDNQQESEPQANIEEIPKMTSVPPLRSSIKENGESDLNFPVKKRKSTVKFEFPEIQDNENNDNIKIHPKKRSKSDDDIKFPKLSQNNDDDTDDIHDAASEPMGKEHTRANRLSSLSGKVNIDPRNIPRRFSKMTIEQIDQVIKTEDELRDAITFFNKNKDPSKLCEYYDVDETPENIATIFWGTRDINSSILGQYLIKKKDILDAYFMEVEMDKGPIQSLRNALLGPMRFDGESQTVHKVLSSISRCYALKNPDKCDDPDNILDLYYALIMLNTDLSNPNNKTKMTLQEFIRNTKGANDFLSTIADEELTGYYKNIQKKPILFQNQSDDFVYDFCPKIRGYLKKKSIHTFGTWTKKYFVLINNILYYFRDDNPENAKEPLGAVYLKGVEPIRDRDNTPLLIRIIAKKKELKYAKFTNGQKESPRYSKGIKEIILEAPDRASSSKWYHYIRVAAQVSNFLKEKKVEIAQEKNVYEADVPDAADDPGEECDQ